MRTRIVSACLAAAAALGLAGCGDPGAGGNGAQPKQAQTKIRNRPNEALLARNDLDRRITLVRAIRQTGNRCPRRVEPNPVYQGDYRGMGLWTARCDNNVQYAVFIAPNEIVQVRRCEHMAQLDLPACRELPPAEPNVERPKARPKA